MSGGRYKDYEKDVGGSYRGLTSEDEGTRLNAERERRESLGEARRRIADGTATRAPKRETAEVVDRSLARSAITRPAKDAERVHIVDVDNSGSNAIIANFLRETTGYLLSVLKVIDPGSQLAIRYISDHCDRSFEKQECDFVSPTEQGDKVLASSIASVRGATGGDAPEAFECSLASACDIDFGHVQQRHLYLVTDEVGHGMGQRGDDGCPHGTDWRESLERVRSTYTTFEVIGCGDDARTAKLQHQFLSPDRVAMDFLDLSAIPSHQHRCGITANALLFLIARKRGMQCVEVFLMTLYAKWLSDPIFGANTDLKAKEAITRFTKFLEIDAAAKEKLLDRIFA